MAGPYRAVGSRVGVPAGAGSRTGSVVGMEARDWIDAFAASLGVEPPDEATVLDRIAFYESRCVADIIGDRTVGDSYGILQIHTDTFCEPSTYWPSGYLQAALILESCVELFDPAIAVKAARAIFLAYGFEAWSTYEKAIDS